jgi:hypothetical protein
MTTTIPSTLDWREFWRAESVRLGFDWPSIVATHLTIVDQLRDADNADVRMTSSAPSAAATRVRTRHFAARAVRLTSRSRTASRY